MEIYTDSKYISFSFSYFVAATLTEIPQCLCIRNNPTEVSYDHMSQVLTVALNLSLTVNTQIDIFSCRMGIEEKYLNQTCSAIDFNLSPQMFNNFTVIVLPPVCNACESTLDSSIKIATDFRHNGECFLHMFIMAVFQMYDFYNL